MKMLNNRIQDNTILVTGGNSGIGEALAVAFHKAGNHVIIAGRRADALAKVTAANKGMISYVLDVADGKAVAEFAKTIAKNHPDLNVLVNNAGIGRVENPEVTAWRAPLVRNPRMSSRKSGSTNGCGRRGCAKPGPRPQIWSRTAICA